MLKYTLIFATALAFSFGADAANGRLVNLKDSDGTIVGPVVEASDPTVAKVAINTSYGPGLVIFLEGNPLASSFTKYFTTADCSDTPLVSPSFGVWADTYVGEEINAPLFVARPTTLASRNIVSRIQEPGGFPCEPFAAAGMMTAELVLADNLLTTYTPPYKVEVVDESAFHALSPCRLLDTRLDQTQTDAVPLNNPGPHSFRVQGNCGVPNGAKSVALNLTVTGPTRAGDLRLYPFAQSTGPADPSAINYVAGQTIANAQVLTLSPVVAAGDKDMKIVIGMGGAGSTHVIIDITGYFN